MFKFRQRMETDEAKELYTVLGTRRLRQTYGRIGVSAVLKCVSSGYKKSMGALQSHLQQVEDVLLVRCRGGEFVVDGVVIGNANSIAG